MLYMSERTTKALSSAEWEEHSVNKVNFAFTRTKDVAFPSIVSKICVIFLARAGQVPSWQILCEFYDITNTLLGMQICIRVLFGQGIPEIVHIPMYPRIVARRLVWGLKIWTLYHYASLSVHFCCYIQSGYWHRSISVIKHHNMAIDTDVYTCPEHCTLGEHV